MPLDPTKVKRKAEFVNRMHRKVEYALMALKHMSSKNPGELTTAKEVVAVTKGPFDAVARVMQKMAQRGLLKSEHGVYGGYVIVKDLGRVTLYELMEDLTGPMEVVKCLGTSHDCDLTVTCNIQSPVAQFNRKLGEFYRSISLAELLRVRAGA